MSNYTEFEGINLITDPVEKILATVLIRNELGGVSNGYQIDHAETPNSGFSFGGNQMDLSTGNKDYNDLFREIVISQIGQSFYNSIADKITQKGSSNILTNQERNQIDLALSSDYGKQLINQAFVDDLDSRSQRVNNLSNLLETEFSNDVKVALVDYDNQYGIDLNSTSSSSMRSKLQTILNQNGVITLEDVENSVRSTDQYKSNRISQEYRIQQTRQIIKNAGLINDSDNSVIVEVTNDIKFDVINTIMQDFFDPSTKLIIKDLDNSGKTYTIQLDSAIETMAEILGTTVDSIVSNNPWISQMGQYWLLDTSKKLSLPASEIKTSVKFEDVTLKNSNGTELGTYTNFFLDKANQTLLTNTELNSQWQVNNNPNSSLANATIEFDFNSLAQSVLGTGNKNWNGVDVINNAFLDLSIRTDLQSDFLSSNDITQTGNVISGGDYDITAPIINLNGDGLKNVAPYSIVSDGYRPGNSELSQYSTLNTELKADFSKLDNLVNQINQQQNYQQNNQQQNPALPDISKLNLQLQNPLANLTNNAINARTFINIDPVVLDLNGDGVKLTSYNDSEVTFDVDNEGKQKRTGWVTPQDGILVDDKNHDGKINNITETISEYYNPNDGSIADVDGKYSTDGLAALKKLDSNHDGKFNNQDAKWNDLKVWVDANGDAVTDAGELKTLTEAGVKEINLTNILPKNFSIITAIEKSLKSGNREYCRIISASNPKGLLIVEKLHGKEFMVSKIYMKYCFDQSKAKGSTFNVYEPSVGGKTKVFGV